MLIPYVDKAFETDATFGSDSMRYIVERNNI